MFSEPFLVLGPAFQRDLHVTVVAVPHTRPSKDELANEHLLQPVLACCRRPGVWSYGRDRGNTGMFYRSSLGDTDVVVSGSSTRVFQRLGSLSLARDGCHSLRGGDVGGSSSWCHPHPNAVSTAWPVARSYRRCGPTGRTPPPGLSRNNETGRDECVPCSEFSSSTWAPGTRSKRWGKRRTSGPVFCFWAGGFPEVEDSWPGV